MAWLEIDAVVITLFVLCGRAAKCPVRELLHQGRVYRHPLRHAGLGESIRTITSLH